MFEVNQESLGLRGSSFDERYRRGISNIVLPFEVYAKFINIIDYRV